MVDDTQYEDFPLLDWEDEYSAAKAAAHLLDEACLIILMPREIALDVDPEECGCDLEEDDGVLYSCDPGEALELIAEKNGIDALIEVAEAAAEAGVLLDIDLEGRRLIFHGE